MGFTPRDGSTPSSGTKHINKTGLISLSARQRQLAPFPVLAETSRKAILLSEGDAPGDAHRELAALKRMYRLGLRHGLVATMPYISLLTEHNVRKGFFELDQFRAIRRFFADAPELKLYRTADGRLGFQAQLTLAPGDRGRFEKAYRAVMKVLGAKRGRPAGYAQGAGETAPLHYMWWLAETTG